MSRGGWSYRIFKAYFKLLNNKLLYRKVYLLGKENIPENGDRLMVVSNHQNNANDAIGLILAFKNKQFPTTFTSGVFLSKVPFLGNFFYNLGMLPAYRADYEGLENVNKNKSSMEEMKRRLREGLPVIIYPEGTGQFGHYIGRFIPNYLHLAFQAAEADGWKYDVKVLPAANHYSDYFDVQTEFMIRIAPPFSLKPYYGRYREKPRTTVREINEILFRRVKEMMLHVEDVEHYEEIDFLRNSAFGDSFAGGKPPLPERLEKDQRFVELIENCEEKDIYEKSAELKRLEEKFKLKDQWVAESAGWARTVLDASIELFLLPFWLLGLWPFGLFYWLPTLLLSDNLMYTNTYRVLVNSLLLVPLALLITLSVLGGKFGMWWLAIMWILLWVPIGRFEWWMWSRFKRTRGRIFLLMHADERAKMKAARDNIATYVHFS
jgi:1-acyl-sn-glycerol-3-phosphate acyltransferase